MDIPGNEKADEEAKKAAIPTQSREISFNHKPLKSARNRIIKETTNREWEQAWKSRNHNSRFFRRITTKQNVEKGPKLYSRLTKRRQISQLTIAPSTSIFTGSKLKTPHCANAEAEPSKLSTTTYCYIVDTTRNELHSLKM
jgi:hypothetical protein